MMFESSRLCFYTFNLLSETSSNFHYIHRLLEPHFVVEINIFLFLFKQHMLFRVTLGQK